MHCAAVVGVTHASWLDWESGKKVPRVTHALKIAAFTEGDVPIESWADDTHSLSPAPETSATHSRVSSGAKL